MLLLVARSSLTVRDQGPGVPKDALQNIFSPFFRINGPGRRRAGNGLGLAIVLEAIRLTGLSPLQISIRRGSRLASDCPCQILP
jgi:signal transduction histidine kinase